MTVRAIFAPACRRRTARWLPYQIQMMFGRAVIFIQLYTVTSPEALFRQHDRMTQY
jgi:hypothetical protein